MTKQKRPTKAVANLVTRAIPAPAPTVTERTPIDLIMGARLARQLNVSSVTLWRWRKAGDFPAGRRINGHVYFSQSAVLAWLAEQQAA